MATSQRILRYDVTQQVKMSSAMKEALQERAAERGVTVSDLVRESVTAHLNITDKG